MKEISIKERFINYFKKLGHLEVDPSPVIQPANSDLLFTNAGMNQFKDIILGQIKADVKRLVNCQSCIRLSGKHNDFEEVGYDGYHHTMFGMLGNWSFGDYWKEEAIEYAWKFLTEELNIPKNILWITYYKKDRSDESNTIPDDIETLNIWKKYINQILPFDKENFWSMGDTGPCGMCTEIHIDLRDEEDRSKESAEKYVNGNNPDVIELWNLVFMEYNKTKEGKYESLDMKVVDTGMGLERLVRVIENKKSNYETSLFEYSINKLHRFTDVGYGEYENTDVAYRVISDHIRTISELINEGLTPSNKGAGYVLRKLIRRCIVMGRIKLNTLDGFLRSYVYEIYGNNLVAGVVHAEENVFNRTLDKAIKRLNKIIVDTIENDEDPHITAKESFELYDTFGLPLEITKELAKAKSVRVLPGFEECMEKQKELSRQSVKQQ